MSLSVNIFLRNFISDVSTTAHESDIWPSFPPTTTLHTSSFRTTYSRVMSFDPFFLLIVSLSKIFPFNEMTGDTCRMFIHCSPPPPPHFLILNSYINHLYSGPQLARVLGIVHPKIPHHFMRGTFWR